MPSNDPIRMQDFINKKAPGAFTPGGISRAEAGRQFRFSLALVATLVFATVAVAMTVPMAGSRDTGAQVAHNNASDLTYTVVR